MIEIPTDERIATLNALLRDLGRVAVAVSGGVDSLTLALLAGRVLGTEARMCHAVSAAVPAAATARVEQTAAVEGWNLQLLNAGELGDEAYLRNPYRRCYHCKSRLYAALSGVAGEVVLSGTNADDLGDFRPGLQAAAEHDVRHPFVECGIDKAGVRRICGRLGYADVADLPASPCLSSRVETGVRIQAPMLDFIDRVENLLRERLAPDVVRCRIGAQSIRVQLDPRALDALSGTADWAEHIRVLAAPLGLPQEVCFEHYRMGSAFVGSE